MYLCDNGHDEVCYDCRNCPVCAEQETTANLEEKIEELNDKIKELNNA